MPRLAFMIMSYEVFMVAKIQVEFFWVVTSAFMIVEIEDWNCEIDSLDFQLCDCNSDGTQVASALHMVQIFCLVCEYIHSK
jgi:hypothetical protein